MKKLSDIMSPEELERFRKQWNETEPTPDDDDDIHWWAGHTECAVCDWVGVSVMPIPHEWDEPIIPMECAGCGGMTVGPA